MLLTLKPDRKQTLMHHRSRCACPSSKEHNVHVESIAFIVNAGSYRIPSLFGGSATEMALNMQPRSQLSRSAAKSMQVFHTWVATRINEAKARYADQ
jgi:hypothetical protein